jgi:prokaryotic YEATS domain
MEWLTALGPYVPLIQTFLWCTLIGLGVGLFFRQCTGILEAIRLRVETGSSLRAGPIELGGALRRLPYVEPNAQAARPADRPPSESTPDGPWAERRDAIYKQARGVFLVHVIRPSREPGQSYDIFVYLKRHKSSDFTDVSFAEFFFGHYWGNEVFREERRDGLIGISTSAYGPFLCTCRVTFKDGHVADLHRYVDFEMGRMFGQDYDSDLRPPSKLRTLT